MPQEVEIDGVKQTLYSEEEFKANQEDINKQKEVITKLQTELGIQDDSEKPIESLFEKVSELKESANPNWQEARKVIKNLKTALTEKGVEIDESTGQIKSNPQGISTEEIQKMIDDGIAKGINSATLKLNKDDLLSGYNNEDRAKIEPVLDKLMTLGGTLKENLELAEAKIFPDRAGNATRRTYNSAVGGGAQQDGIEENKFAKSPEGKAALSSLGIKIKE